MVAPARRTDADLRTWLGRPLSVVPAELRVAVVEYALGATIEEVTTYAAHRGWLALGAIDPELQNEFEVVAERAVEALVATLPQRPLERWQHDVIGGVVREVRRMSRARAARHAQHSFGRATPKR